MAMAQRFQVICRGGTGCEESTGFWVLGYGFSVWEYLGGDSLPSPSITTPPTYLITGLLCLVCMYPYTSTQLDTIYALAWFLFFFCPVASLISAMYDYDGHI